jgi:4-amino-4-deoxy-L-arabinose transferase-like glycosyltransferase
MRSPMPQLLHKNQAICLMVLILLVATALRVMAIGQVPPGLYHDEAYNGTDALGVLDGDLSLYFAANNGREPMFIYLIVFWVGLLGRNPFAVRLAAFVPGLLTIAATYALARALFTRLVGLLGAAVLSVTLWHVHLSRVGFRAVLLPLFVALFVWQVALGWRTGRRRYWVVAGVLYGLSFYTYMAARFSLVALVLFGSYLLLTRRRWRTRQAWTPIAWSGLPMLATLTPLVLFTIVHPDLVLGRTGQVSIWNGQINGGDFWGTLARNTTRTLGMFFVRGDRIWRHNVPWRPVFDPLLGTFFLIGLVRALRGFRRDARLAMLVIWTATMMLPTLLAEDAPHFLRAVGVLPLVVLFPVLGMDWLLHYGYSLSRNAHYALRLALIAVLSVSLIATLKAYFGDYAQADLTAYWFEDGAEALAGAVNRFLGTGWDGDRMLRSSGSAGERATLAGQPGLSEPTDHVGSTGGRVAYIEPGLWETWPSLPFLVAESPQVRLLPQDGAWPAVDKEPTAVFAWPYANWRRVWSMLSEPVDMRVEEGALSQGDQDAEPFTTYRAFYITPLQPVPSALVRFQGGVELVDAKAESADQGMRVELSWHATERLTDDYTVFVHYMRDGQRLGQHDAQPASGHYPTSRWRVGDLVHDDHLIVLPGPPDPARDQIILGLYRSQDGQRLDVLDPAGNPAGTFVTLPVNEVLR